MWEPDASRLQPGLVAAREFVRRIREHAAEPSQQFGDLGVSWFLHRGHCQPMKRLQRHGIGIREKHRMVAGQQIIDPLIPGEIVGSDGGRPGFDVEDRFRDWVTWHADNLQRSRMAPCTSPEITALDQHLHVFRRHASGWGADKVGDVLEAGRYFLVVADEISDERKDVQLPLGQPFNYPHATPPLSLGQIWTSGQGNARRIGGHTCVQGVRRDIVLGNRSEGVLVGDEITIIRGSRFVVTTCGQCGVVYTVPEVRHDQMRAEGGYASCPNGHQWGWSPEQCERERLRRERDLLKQRVAQRDDEIAQLERLRIAAEATIATERRSHTKTMRRIQGGACPCCNRFFVNVARHMESKHKGRVVPIAAAS